MDNFKDFWNQFRGAIIGVIIAILILITGLDKLILAIVVIALGAYMLQFTIISESGIKTRCLWRTIRKLKWEEVKEVRLESFYVSSANGFTSRWYVFDDGEERFQKNGIVHKNSHITLLYSKRAQRAVETFWKGEVVNKVYEEDEEDEE